MLGLWSLNGLLDSVFLDSLDQVFLCIGFDDVKMACFCWHSKSIRLKGGGFRFLGENLRFSNFFTAEAQRHRGFAEGL
jgi:hypothetical protein